MVGLHWMMCASVRTQERFRKYPRREPFWFVPSKDVVVVWVHGSMHAFDRLVDRHTTAAAMIPSLLLLLE